MIDSNHKQPQRDQSVLFNLKSLQAYSLYSLNKEIGKVKDLYFDDHNWGVRYLVADTGNWLTKRQVLISPHAFLAVNEAEQTIMLNLTYQQIEDSPFLRIGQPISRKFEKSYFAYYGWPSDGDARSLDLDSENAKADTPNLEARDPHLRSIKEVSAYQIQAKEDTLKQVEDFILDLDAWVIRYLIVNTQNGWPGKKALISSLWVDRLSSKQSKVFVKYLSETIKQAPEYKGLSQLTRQAEQELHQYYDRQGSWNDEWAAKAHSLN